MNSFLIKYNLPLRHETKNLINNQTNKYLKKFLFFLFYLTIIFFVSCSGIKQQKNIITPEKALIKVGWWGRPTFSDDLDKESLINTIEKNFDYLNRLPDNRKMYYGNLVYFPEEVKESYRHFITILKESKNNEDLNKRIIKDFDIFQSVGRDNKKNVLYTGYYEPVLKGSLIKTDKYKYPIYSKPKDLIKINLSKFNKSLKGRTIVARIDNEKVVPYHSRKEIDRSGKLSGQNLELAWLSDPIDLFFLHIQGSGIIEFEDGSSINVNYAASNGKGYRSIGRLLINEGTIPKEKMSMMSLYNYINTHPEELERIFDYNESYVFFREVDQGPVGNTSVVLTAKRSIASDRRIFPKGGLAFLETEVPITNEVGEVINWKNISRFVIDQDTGGAIKGPGRIDIFFGTGKEAGKTAGAMNRNGKIYYLIKKK